MMKKVIGVIICLLVAALTYSQVSHAVSYESITVAATAKAITAGTLTLVHANGSCSGRLETAQIRFRVDGTDPTSAEGVLMEIGEFITIRGLTNLLAFRAIRTGGSSGILKLHCYQ
jgi:hypothetical protein